VLPPATTDRSLPERERTSTRRFGAFRPYLLALGYPARFLFLPIRLAGQPPLNAALRNDLAGVALGVSGISAALADELGLRNPVVFVNVAARGTFLRRIVRRNIEAKFPLPTRFVLQKYLPAFLSGGVLSQA
jgi:hypothetical protein